MPADRSDLETLAAIILDQEAGLTEGRYLKLGGYLIPAVPPAQLEQEPRT